MLSGLVPRWNRAPQGRKVKNMEKSQNYGRCGSIDLIRFFYAFDLYERNHSITPDMMIGPVNLINWPSIYLQPSSFLSSGHASQI